MCQLKNDAANTGARQLEMEFGSRDGGEKGKHSGVSFVEISKIFSTQDKCNTGK